MNKSLTAAAATAAASLSLAIGAFAADSGSVEPSNHMVVVTSPALDDATIVAIFDAANTADIETGELAVRKGSTKEVREFGAMLVRDHRAVRQQGRDLAAKLGVVPTPPADDESAKSHAAAMAALRSAKRAAFDHAFLQHEVAFHKAVIAAVNSTLLPAISNAELRKLVVTVAPAFQAHMIAADNLDKKQIASRKQ